MNILRKEVEVTMSVILDSEEELECLASAWRSGRYIGVPEERDSFLITNVSVTTHDLSGSFIMASVIASKVVVARDKDDLKWDVCLDDILRSLREKL